MSEQTLSPPRRLRRSVSARTLEGRGIAVSAGRTAVVLDGAAAEQLWAAIEPVLRTGVAVPDLLDRLPAAARPAAGGLLDQLEEHALLCAATAPAEGPLGEHFERTADDPAAASAAAARTAVEVGGDDAGLVAEILEAFAGTGLRVRASRTPAVPLPGAPGATVTTYAPGAEPGDGDAGRSVLVLRAGDWRLVGPAPDSRGAREALRSWATRARALAGPANAARDGIADRLAGAQAVLDTLTTLSADRPGAPDATPARYHLTSPDVVSEVHPLVALPDLAPGGELLAPEVLIGHGAGGAGTDGDFLEQTEQLWLGPLSPWSGPVPGDLPQLPVGLAVAGTAGHPVAEAGVDTADARAACVERLAEFTAAASAAASDSATGPSGVIGVGRDPSHAVARAVTHWAHAHLTWTDPDEGRPETLPGSPFARRLWTALTIREGVVASTRTRTATVGGAPDLVLVEVLDAAGRVLGSGLATTAAAALDEALVPAVGSALPQAGPRTTADSAPRPRLEPTRLALAAWAAVAPVEVRRPGGAPGWVRLGLHPRTVTARTSGSGTTS